jgi:hypothetical protein
MFIRKDFPQRLGLGIVIVAAMAFLVLAANPRTLIYGVLVLCVAAVVDAMLYFFVGRVTVCYRCRAEFRDCPLNPDHEPFELSVAEKYRMTGGG